ncbi:MAG TPA: DUF5123 domain-containing protein [Phnomibacter sp.]|nr:DUF5123 domain-containing protein [Phnomibacter sp.]
MPGKIIKSICAVVLLAGFVAACKKEALPPQERLFRPVIKGSLTSEGNYINVAWERMQGAVSYTLELSRDTFKTIDASITMDSSHYTFTNLYWNKPYQLQVRSNAPDSIKNSHFAYLGEIKTPKFPTILATPGINDILPTKVRVSWKTEGAPVTSIKILKWADSSVVSQTPLLPADVSANFKIIGGLQPATKYIIYLYSGTSVRGWDDFTTSAQLTGTIIDLTDITDRPKVLLDTLPFIDNGSIVLLKKGMVYTMNTTYNINKSVTITSGPDLLITEPATLYFTSNFAFAAAATVDYVRFENLKMRSDNYGSRYVFNVTGAVNCGEISFKGCEMGAFRGISRMQDQTIVIGKYVVDNCKVDSLGGYGVLSVDGAKALVQNMSLTNSTFSKCEKVIACAKPTSTMNGVVVENCTFMEAALGGAAVGATGGTLFDFQTQKFTGNISFKNNIIGPGWRRDPVALLSVTIRGIRPGTGSIDAVNNYLTADASIATDSPIPNVVLYTKPTTDMFVDYLNGNFKIKDASFPGKANAGDPRWRP